MSRADIALLVAIFSAAFTAGGLLWQFLLYRLSGHRLHVRLVPAILDSANTIVRGPERGFPSEIPSEMKAALTPWTVDLAEIQVTNIGRMPVSVSEIALDFRGTQPWWRLKPHTVRGTPIDLHGASTETTVRLETADQARVLFEIWPLVARVPRDKGRRIAIRGTAQAAGRRARLSPWRKRWVFEQEQSSLRGEESLTPSLRAYRTLWGLLAGDSERLNKVGPAWLVTQDALEEGATEKDLAARLEPILGPEQLLTAAFVLAAFKAGTHPGNATH